MSMPPMAALRGGGLCSKPTAGEGIDQVREVVFRLYIRGKKETAREQKG